jgi:23S rRNA C2498 (ribose-2'-O)-methylase RlmM
LVTKGVDVDGLGDQIAELAAHIDAAMHGLLTAIRESDLARGWAKQGALSCAHWLAWRIGWDLTTPRERLRVAKKLAELAIVDEELRLKAMSYSKARAISRVATAGNEQLWVEYAKRMPAPSLDNLCRSFASVVSNVAMQAEHVAAKRAVTRRTRDDGMVKIELILTNDEAAMV